MPVQTVRDVIDPRMYLAFQIFGYALFALGWVFIACAARQALKSHTFTMVKARVARSTPQSSKLTVPNRMLPARVLAFPARKTRNRVVVR